MLHPPFIMLAWAVTPDAVARLAARSSGAAAPDSAGPLRQRRRAEHTRERLEGRRKEVAAMERAEQVEPRDMLEACSAKGHYVDICVTYA